MLTTKEHVLVCLNEECAEVGKECDKALRFGLTDTAPDKKTLTNQELIVQELNDVLGTARLAVELGVLPVNWQDEKAQERKRDKIITNMVYAMNRGTLENGLLPFP